tara:strand:+ start:112 stop:261 length:150 start_codon:yes stop_codon:yes gene_type:complete
MVWSCIARKDLLGTDIDNNRIEVALTGIALGAESDISDTIKKKVLSKER